MVGVSELQGGAPKVRGSPQPTAVSLMSQDLPNRQHSHPPNTNSKNLDRWTTIGRGGPLMAAKSGLGGPLLAAKGGLGVHFLPGTLLA